MISGCCHGVNKISTLVRFNTHRIVVC